MSVHTTSARLASITLGLALSLTACAAESDAPYADEAEIDEVSSALPLAAVSMTGASFAGLGLGATGAIGTLGTTGTIGAAGSVNATGQIGSTITPGPLGFGSTFSTGPMGFSTGPMGFSTSFDSGPIGFSGGGTTTISSGTGMTPVISHTCTGFGCP